jgi:hypothetical protein
MKYITKTTEFTLTLAVLVTDLATSLTGVLPAHVAAYVGSVALVGYQISRGLAKFNANPTGEK